MKNHILMLVLLIIPASLFADHIPARILETDWLAGQLNSEHLRIIDSRSPKKYAKSHIPGAVNLPVNLTFAPKPRNDLVAPVTQISKLFGEAGIDFNHDVVIYDDGEFIDAARLVWILEAHGHTHVAILNGGFTAWTAAGNSQSQEIVKPEPTLFVPAVNPDRIASKFSTRMAIDNPNIQIVDSRANEEYLGKKSKASRKGRIPTAANVPWDMNYTENKEGIVKLKPRDELEKMYQHIDRDRKVITYCNKGKQSALSHFVLRDLGYDVAAYDGSWFEWGNDYSLPIELPESNSADN